MTERKRGGGGGEISCSLCSKILRCIFSALFFFFPLFFFKLERSSLIDMHGFSSTSYLLFYETEQRKYLRSCRNCGGWK